MGWRFAAAVALLSGSLGCTVQLAQAAAPPQPAAMLGPTIATLPAESPISAGQGWLVWSTPEGGGWKLHTYHSGEASTLPIAARPEPFDATVGSNDRGQAVATFSRCKRTPGTSGVAPGGMLEEPTSGRGCRIHAVELATGRESLVPIPDTAGGSDTSPAMWRGAVAFARELPRHGLVSQILIWSPRHPRALATLPHGFVPSECALRNCRGYFGYGEAQALAYDGSSVAFVWEPKESFESLHEAWEDRVDNVSSGRGRVVGGAGTSESCTGFAPVEERYPSTPFLLGTSAYFTSTERGDCYKRYGSGVLVARPGARLEATVATPILAWAADPSAAYALVAKIPTAEEEADCTSAMPCTLQEATLPKLSPARFPAGHAFFS